MTASIVAKMIRARRIVKTGGKLMKYFFIGMIIVSVFFLRPAHAGVFTCYLTLINCLSTDLDWCSYNGDGFWDTLYSYESGLLESGESDTPGCSSESACYFVGQETDSIVWDCTSFDVTGFIDCNDYGCVDGDVSWNSGSSEYCCSDNTCSTDCSD